MQKCRCSNLTTKGLGLFFKRNYQKVPIFGAYTKIENEIIYFQLQSHKNILEHCNKVCETINPLGLVDYKIITFELKEKVLFLPCQTWSMDIKLFKSEIFSLFKIDFLV